MITTVTTSTVTTVTTMGLAMGLIIVAVVSLAIFLAIKELAGARASARSLTEPEGTSLRVAKFLNVCILPLFATFAVVIVANILEALG